MWQALANVAPLVARKGQLFISIYNDQGRASMMWTRVKRAYVLAPGPLKGAILMVSLVRLWGPSAVRNLLGGELKSLRPAKQVQPRGMDLWHDAKDWVGGYPFEVAKPEEIFDFYRDRGFELQRMITCGGGLGCNQFVFARRTGK
jgi:2-polyprenyl-6-hydroxyphenyl methylase/3-demethylubiquinone-9 3-methyltransferase